MEGFIFNGLPALVFLIAGGICGTTIERWRRKREIRRRIDALCAGFSEQIVPALEKLAEAHAEATS